MTEVSVATKWLQKIGNNREKPHFLKKPTLKKPRKHAIPHHRLSRLNPLGIAEVCKILVFYMEDRRVRFRELKSANDIINLVGEIGFLPFFANDIVGFSIEECCPLELWFAEDADGPWEWKGPIARSGRCVYGKFFNKKAGFVSLKWFPEFANYRRDGYDFDARYEDGLASYKDKGVYDTITANGALLSKNLKDICNYRKGGNKGFDTVITRLQMQTYVNIADFVYMQDKYGHT